MHYNLIITDRAEELIDNCLNHLVFRLQNEQAATHLLNGIEKLYDRLVDNPFQFADCSDLFLKSKGYKEALIPDMEYQLIFSIEDNTVYILGFFHQLENYKLKV